MPRGAKPGERRGGRRAGSKNKITRIGDVAAKLEAMGHDPIEGMAMLASERGKDGKFINSPELRGKMNAELAQYIAPKRKAVEHSGPGGGPIEVGASEARQRVLGRIGEYAAPDDPPANPSGPGLPGA